MAKMRETSPEWERAWNAYQAEVKRQDRRYEKAFQSADTRMRDMAEACGFDSDAPLHTARNWYKSDPDCAEQIFAVERKINRLFCERANALSRAFNRLFVPLGTAESQMQDCRRMYPRAQKRYDER